MKILHVTASDTGGAGLAAIRTHKALLNKGLDSKILFLNQSKKIEQSVLYKRDYNFSPYIIPTLTFKNYLLEKLFRYFSKKNNLTKQKILEKEIFIQQIKQDSINLFECFTSPITDFDITIHNEYNEADLIHFHFIGDFLDFQSFFKKNTKPVFWSMHDENLTLGCFHFEIDLINNIDKYKTIDYNFRKIKKYSLFHSKCKSIILSGSDWQLKKIEGIEFFKTLEKRRFYYPVDTKVFRYIEKTKAKEVLNIPKDKKTFLFIAGDTKNKRKGFDLLLPIIEDQKFKDVLFIVMGKLSYNLKTDNILELGPISDEILMPIVYASADYYILPSRAEGFSYAMSEALCCGTPILAFDVADHKNFIEKNNFGIVVSELSSSALKKHLIYILEKKYQFDNIKISIDSQKFLNSEKVGQEIIEIYNEFI